MRKGEISWGDETCCFDMFGMAVPLTLFAMLLNLRAVWRYMRYDVMP